MIGTRCPACAESFTAPVGAAVACPACQAWCWAIANQPVGEAFTGVATERPGFLATLWSAVAALGVLGAFWFLLGLELWAVWSLVGAT